MYQTPPLPYAYDALAPAISADTLRVHHDGHHAAYVEKLNHLLEAEPAAFARPLEGLVTSAHGAVFENASQAWNHAFYWNCLSPNGGGSARGALADALKGRFGSERAFKQAFTKAGAELFGSGWVWLVTDADGDLDVVATHDADSPLVAAKRPVLVCDVWEHAYYLDYQNARADFLQAFWAIVNWEFAQAQYA